MRMFSFLTILLLLMIYTEQVFSAYSGCYKDDYKNRHFKTFWSGYSLATFKPAVCQSQCGSSGHAYSAILHKFYCFCGDTLPPIGDKEDGQCLPCDNEAGEECGSRLHLSVYDSKQPIESVEMYIPNRVIRVGDHVTVNVSAAGVNPSNYKASYFQDATGFDWSLPFPLAVQQTWKAFVPNDYVIQTKVQDNDEIISAKYAALSIYVYDHVKGDDIELECPPKFASFETSQCFATIWYGSSLNIKWSIDDVLAHTILMSDVPMKFFGNSVALDHASYLQQTAPSLYLKPSTEIDVYGRLIGFQMMADVAGTIQLMVLCPSCADYCFETNICGGPCNEYTSCSPGVTALQMRGGKRRCSGPAPSRYTPLQTYDYTIRYESTYTMTGTGENYYRLPDVTSEVSPGCIIAYREGSGKLQCKNETDTLLDDNASPDTDNVVGATIQVIGSSDTLKVAYLTAVVSEGFRTMIEKTFLTPGNKSIMVEVETVNVPTTEPPANQSTVVVVIVGVDQVIPDVQSCGFVDTPITFSVLDHQVKSGKKNLPCFKTNETSGLSSLVVIVGVNQVIPDVQSCGFVDTPITFSVQDHQELTELCQTRYNRIKAKFLTNSSVKDEVSVNCIFLPVWIPGSEAVLVYRGTEVTYTWDYGDGDEFNTTARSHDHTYKASGDYNVTVTAFNSKSSKTNTTQITVVIELTGLNIDANASRSDRVTPIAFSLVNGSHFQCLWNFGDGSQNTTGENSLAMTGDIYGHQFPGENVYNVTATCSNLCSNVTDTVSILIEDPIINLHLITPGKEAGTTFQLQYGISAGSNPSFWSWFNDTEIAINNYNAVTKIVTTGPIVCAKGLNNVTMKANNSISSEQKTIEFPCEERIGVVTVTCNASTFHKNDVVSCCISITGGNGITIEVDWGDGGPSDIQNGSAASPFINNQCFEHNYTQSGVLTAAFKLTNSFDSKVTNEEFKVVAKIAGLKLFSDCNSTSPGLFSPPCLCRFWFEVNDAVTDVNYTMKFGDDNEESGLYENKEIVHSYRKNGQFSCEFNLKNDVSDGTAFAQVHVIERIVDGTIKLRNNFKAIPYGQETDLILSYYRAPSKPDCSIDFKKGNAAEVALDRTGSGKDGEDILETTTFNSGDCNVPASDKIRLRTNTSSLREFDTITQDFECLWPVVKSDFSFDCKTKLVPGGATLPMTQECNITFIGGGPQPDTATIKYVVNGNTVEKPFTIPYLFSVPILAFGETLLTATISNDASAATFVEDVGIYKGVACGVQVKYREAMPLTSPLQDSTFVSGKYSVPFGSIVHFDTSGTTGTFNWQSLSLTNAGNTTLKVCNQTEGPFEFHIMTESEHYADILIYNPYSQCQEDLTISVMKRVYGLKVTESGGTLTKTFTFSLDCLDPPTFLEIDWGDGNTETVSFDSNPKEILYTYSSEGAYTLKVKARNPVSSTEYTYTHSVLTNFCTKPEVDIKTKNLFASPLKLQRKESIRFVGMSNINCSYTYSNTKQWTATVINENTGLTSQTIDLSGLQASRTSQLFTPGNFWPVGKLILIKYKMKLTLDLKGVVFEDEVGTYIQIESSDLVVAFTAFPQEISTSTTGTFSIRPIDHCFDQDISPNEDQGITLPYWTCRQINEDETSLYDKIVQPRTLAQLNNPRNGGCFGSGPGIVDASMMTSNGVFDFLAGNFEPDSSYEMCVIGKKDTRSSKACVIINTDKTANASLELKLGSQTKYVRDSTAYKIGRERLHLIADTTSTDVIGWQWHCYQYDYRWDYSWRELLTASEAFLDPSRNEAFIDVEKFLALSEVEANNTEFRIKVMANHSDGTVSSSAVYISTQNYPFGECTIDVSCTGETNDVFELTCSKFSGYGTMKFALFGVHTGDYLKRAIFREIVTTGQHKFKTQLPIGPSDNNFDYSLKLEVCDDLSCQIYDVVTCKIKPLTEPVLTDDLENDLVQSSFYTLTGSLGEPNKYFSEIHAVQSAVEKRRAEFETEYCHYTDIALNLRPTYFGETTRCSPYQHNMTDAAMTSKYSNDRDINSKAREGMLKFCRDLPINSMTEMKFVLGKVALTVRNAPEELTKESVELVTEICKNAYENFQYIDPSRSLDDLRYIFEMLSEIKVAIAIASDINRNHPSQYDLTTGKVADYETNREGTQEVPSSFDPDDIAQEFVGISNRQLTDEFTLTSIGGIQNFKNAIAGQMSSNMYLGESHSLKTDQEEMKIFKDTPSAIYNQRYSLDNSDTGVTFQDDLCPTCDDKTDALTVLITGMNKVCPQFPKGGNNLNPFSRQLEVQIFRNGEEMDVEKLNKNWFYELDRDPNMPFQQSDEKFPDPMDMTLFAHTVKGVEPNCAHQIRFRFTEQIQLLILVKIGQRPKLKGDRPDKCQMVPAKSTDNCTDDANDPCSVFLDANYLMSTKEDIYFLVKQLDVSELDAYPDCSSVPESFPDRNFTSQYIVDIVQFCCPHFDEVTNEWKNDGCMPGNASSVDKVVCHCNHMTTFGGGMVVVPNTIDWGFVFSNLDFMKNPTLYITEILVFVLYIVFLIWARRQDKRDLEKLGLTPLADNDAKSTYCYEIVCVTGMRAGAATDSKVSFIVSGDEDETDVREFSDTKRKLFRRGAINGFLMTTPRPLGNLNYIRIWHDNSGKGKMASWYLSYIVIRDVHTDEKFFFINDKWLAVEEGDGQIDRVVPVAGKEQMTAFGHLFADKARKNLGDGHLWFSVVTRPPRSRFTRVQRVSCCLCLLYMTMLANAMFYEKGESNGATSFTFGPFALSPQQLYIGVVTNLLVFPANFLLVLLFRKSRPKRKRQSRVVQALKDSGPKGEACLSDITTDIRNADTVSNKTFEAPRPDSSLYRSDTPLYTISKGEKEALNMNGSEKPKKKCDLPWWFVIVGWILLWALVIMSAFFVTAYGVTFGDLKCKQWITSMIIAFITSIFITQPIKVFLAAIFFSLVIKNPGGEDEDEFDDEERAKLKGDEQLLHGREEDYLKPRSAAYKPLDPIELEKARIKRLKEIKMWEIVREIVFYCFFLWILMVISYKSRSPISYHFKKSLEKVFILTNDTEHAFTKIRNTDEFYIWAKSGLINGIRAQKYYNGEQPFNLRGYINDKASRIMGYAVMRQLRTQKGTCDVYGIMESTNTVTECNEPYSMLNEDQNSYGKSWKPKFDNETEEMHYTYTSASKLGGYPYWGLVEMYGGGGYVYELRKSDKDMITDLQRMDDEGWIDKYTRAIFIEFTVYNPQINMFGIAILLAELLPSNGFVITYRFEPAMLLPYMSSVVVFQILCEIVYFFFTFVFIFRECRELYRKRKAYFKEFWNWIEMSIIALSITAICIYFYKLFETKRLTNYFHETNGNEYMKFQYIGNWHEVFSYILGFLVFLATLKFLKLLRFNKRMTLLAATLKNGANSLLHFSVIFWIVFLAFVQFFFLTFVGFLRTFNTFVSSMEACILMLMGKFDIYAMLMVEPFLTQLFVFLFLVTVSFILINMFVSLLNETFATCREDINKLDNDYEIVEFMLNRFKLWTGLGTPAAEAVTKAEQEAMEKANCQKLEGQIELFPKRIEKLLSSISNVYLKKDGFEEFMDSGEMGKKRPTGSVPPYSTAPSYHTRGGYPEEQAGLAKVHTNY